ncbi:hypothetical protein PtB15_18B338 [Puccinia triticina]|nr:hypothetical protein PtB15_18B338 [Puccinia triticina]
MTTVITPTSLRPAHFDVLYEPCVLAEQQGKHNRVLKRAALFSLAAQAMWANIHHHRRTGG